jgi:acyl-CoA thioesterase-2
MRTMADQTNPAPSSSNLIDGLLRLLDVEDKGEDLFQGRRKPGGVGRIFGGQVIAQALVAAERSVGDDRPVHSLHAYFLRGGNEDHPIDFAVERPFDGRSFSNRRVLASQQGKPILTLAASFHRPESGATHSDAMPQVPPPEELPNDTELREAFAKTLEPSTRAFVLRPQPIELRPVETLPWVAVSSHPPISNIWMRCVGNLPDDPRIHRAILAYASDLTLLGTATLPHGLNWIKRNVDGASLDHALWFHDDFRADDWLLYSCDSPWAGNARGFSRGRFFTRDGRLVAEAAQEGLIRAIVPAT